LCKKVGVFIQARLSSKRLERKMLLPLGEKTLLERSVEAAKEIPADIHAVLTSFNDYDEIKKLIKGCEVFAGSENDVLDRFCAAIKYFGVDKIVRVTGDKVIIAVEYMNDLLKEKCDLVTYEENPLKSTTGGVYSKDSLFFCNENEINEYNREHVKPSVLNMRSSNFVIKYLEVPENLKKFNFDFTIDTNEDYVFINEMFFKIYNGKPISLIDAIEYAALNKNKTNSFKFNFSL
jgi:spore coat polysaccharide biosynthesis protein SpsF